MKCVGERKRDQREIEVTVSGGRGELWQGRRLVAGGGEKSMCCSFP